MSATAPGTPWVHPAGPMPTAAVLAAVSALVCLLAGCGGSGSLEDRRRSSTATSAGPAGTLVIGSAGFTESQVLAGAYALLLRQAGLRTTVTTVANRELYEPSLEKGQIAIVPEYAATLAQFLAVKAHGPSAAPVASADLGATVRALGALAAPRGLKLLRPSAAVDQNAFAVRKDFAARYRLKTLSDLGRSKVAVRLAAGDECPERPYCLPGLEKVYGIRVSRLDPLGVGTPQARQAVRNGQDDMVLTTTTDATLGQYGLVLPADDRKLQSADNVLPVVNAEKAGSARVAAALDPLADVLTTADLTELNRKVDTDRRKPADVARDYLRSKGLLHG
jgi:osmoprotectant transport system substrate-binding protein